MAKGFTLIELILVLALMGIIVFVAVGFSSNAVPQNQLRSESDTVLDYFRLAQTRSIAGRGDHVWGVHIAESEVTLFAGDDFVSRDVAFDETRTLPPGISASGLTDVVFAFRTGTPSVSGAIIFTDTTINQNRTITIHESGTVGIQ